MTLDMPGLLAYTQQVLTATNDEVATLRESLERVSVERDAFRDERNELRAEYSELRDCALGLRRERDVLQALVDAVRGALLESGQSTAIRCVRALRVLAAAGVPVPPPGTAAELIREKTAAVVVGPCPPEES